MTERSCGVCANAFEHANSRPRRTPAHFNLSGCFIGFTPAGNVVILCYLPGTMNNLLVAAMPQTGALYACTKLLDRIKRGAR